MFEKIFETPWYVYLLLIALIALGIVTLRHKKLTVKELAYAALSISVAFVLSLFRLYRMPSGGSVTPAAMLPLIIYVLAFGPFPGLLAGCAFGLLKLLEDPYVIHPIQFIVDYPMAYGAMILCCVVRVLPDKLQRYKLPIACVLGYIARWIMAVISGAVFFAEYAGDQNAFIYSMVYNATYLGVECALATLIACIPAVGKLVDIITTKKT